jgi:lipid A 4'-phosphatase
MRNSQPHAEDEADEGKGARLIWAGLFFAMAIFAVLPGLDLLVSANYYDPQGGFVHRDDPLVRALYVWTPRVGHTVLLLVAVYALLSPLLTRWFTRHGQPDKAARNRVGQHAAVVALCCALLGPGLLVEIVLKGHMGRPRPVQVVQFGGQDAYHGPFVPGPDPDNHRSFVTSHAAAGFWLMSFGLTCGPVWRRRWFLVGTATGAVIGAGRMLQGGHFLSDVIFAFYAVWLSCELIAWADRRRLSRRDLRSPHASTP